MMKYFALIFFIMGCCGLSALTAGDTNLWTSSSGSLKILDASLLDKVRSGMTFQELVNLLGKSWIMPTEGIGYTYWNFSDGRMLKILPRKYEPTEVFTMKVGDSPRNMWILDKEHAPVKILRPIKPSQPGSAPNRDQGSQ
jgi:hypothetical protein